MPKTHTHLTAAAIANRITHTVVLFSGVLCSTLVLSWYYLLPQLSQVEVAGALRSPREVRTYTDQLKAQLVSLQDKRTELILPVQNDRYRSLRQKQHRQQAFLEHKAQILHVARGFADEQQAIVFSRLAYVESEHAIDLTGDVRNVGPRSMTVLAQFIEALRELPGVRHVPNTRFTREEQPGIGQYSPFSLRLTL